VKMSQVYRCICYCKVY